jgi:pilus assembly protein CpaB
MMKSRVWITLGGALGSGLLAGYLALVYVSEEPVSLMAAEPSGTQVVVAARDLPTGHMVTREDIDVINWPSDNVPEGFYRQPGEVVGRGVITTVRRNEAMLASRLADREAGGGLAIAIPVGKRAVSVEVDEVIGVAGFVLPGTRVDVLVTVMPNTQRTETTTRIILQNVQVLTADQSYQENPAGEPEVVTVVTLLVSPDEAEALTLSSTEGQIQLALRNLLDVDSVSTGGIKIEGLVGSAPPRRTASTGAPTTPAPTQTIVETYRGGTRTLLRFNNKGGGN